MWAAGLESETGPQHPLPPGFPTPINPGADIITNSFGFSVGFPISGLMSDTFDKITANGRGGKGTLLFFSAGNANTSFDLERPWAAYNKTFGIAASSLAADGTKEIQATYSNYAETAIIDLCAPSNDGDPKNILLPRQLYDKAAIYKVILEENVIILALLGAPLQQHHSQQEYLH